MPQYISRPERPQVCEAIKFDTTSQTADFAFAEIEGFLEDGLTRRTTPLDGDGFSVYHSGINAWLEVRPGQYVLKTQPGGHAYPVEEGIFEHAYQPLDMEKLKAGQLEYASKYEVVLGEDGAVSIQVSSPAEELEAPVKKAAPRRRKPAADKEGGE